MAYVTPATDRATLVAFYKKVRPPGPGWNAIRREAGDLGADPDESGTNVPLALLGWSVGCVTIWSSLFTVGNFLYGRTTLGFILLAVFVVSGLVLTSVVKRLWR